MLDRTAEFQSCVAIYNKSHHHGKRKPAAQPSTAADAPKRASEFFSIASGISNDINTTSEKLQRLAQLCQKKSIFEDHTTAIQELTYIIKQDLAKITENVKQLQVQGKDKAHAGQRAVHVESVVGSLNMGVNTATRSFKDILEVRTKNMRESRSRTDAFVHAGTAGVHGSGIASAGGMSNPLSNSPVGPGELRARRVGALPPHLRNNPLYTHRSSSAPPISPTGAHPEPRFEYLSLDDDEEASLTKGTNQADNPYANQQQQALMQEDASAQYLESRSTAIETIESTIAELGGIFQQLAQMVSEQRESVQRIDANTEDVVMNVDRAQYEIARYWRRVSGNRMLMVKIFGILILFFLLFVMLR